MKASQFLISTLKEAPADAEVVSHQLMMRAGMIKRLGAGIYNYMPMGLRVIRKVEAIIRDHTNWAGGLMPRTSCIPWSRGCRESPSTTPSGLGRPERRLPRRRRGSSSRACRRSSA